jgi:hypothetical protein
MMQHGGHSPMKCVHNTNTNEVRRVSEDRAIELTKQGWNFCPKSLWKEFPNTTWVQAVNPPNPMSQAKVRRKELRAQAFKNNQRNG